MKRNENVDPNEVKFRHVRVLREDGTVNNMGGMTISYREVDSNTIEFAAAVCSDKDNYCKKTGRTISAGRMKSPKYTNVVNMTFSEFHAAVNHGDRNDIKYVRPLAK
ncbi:hypothetical protein M0R04_04900 [Candidatus Dojkabacteria bacterium]|nr:hypothetical protein [Candidatus Dojkabacteria bacterium]